MRPAHLAQRLLITFAQRLHFVGVLIFQELYLLFECLAQLLVLERQSDALLLSLTALLQHPLVGTRLRAVG